MKVAGKLCTFNAQQIIISSSSFSLCFSFLSNCPVPRPNFYLLNGLRNFLVPSTCGESVTVRGNVYFILLLNSGKFCQCKHRFAYTLQCIHCPFISCGEFAHVMCIANKTARNVHEVPTSFRARKITINFATPCVLIQIEFRFFRRRKSGQIPLHVFDQSTGPISHLISFVSNRLFYVLFVRKWME